jgi:uncharacterized protein YkwD
MCKIKPVLKTNFFPPQFIFVFLMISLLFFTSATPKEGLTEEVLKYTNQFRKSKGLKALEMRSDLNEIAQKHSKDMASGRTSFGHGGYEKRELQVAKIIKPFGSMAENVAYGARTGKEAVEIWKNSSGHRKNMLGDFTYIGIGTASSKKGVIYYTQIFAR